MQPRYFFVGYRHCLGFQILSPVQFLKEKTKRKNRQSSICDLFKLRYQFVKRIKTNGKRIVFFKPLWNNSCRYDSGGTAERTKDRRTR
ncbi:hypothetical protein HanRHA438_Chr10g0472371 [Helianthus annuus]|nr:hypothetical protein HanRHA438_Chr10g0472371 [Helianthus annuus]